MKVQGVKWEEQVGRRLHVAMFWDLMKPIVAMIASNERREEVLRSRRALLMPRAKRLRRMLRREMKKVERPMGRWRTKYKMQNAKSHLVMPTRPDA